MTAGYFPENRSFLATSPSRRSDVSSLNTPLPKHKMKGILCKNLRAETSKPGGLVAGLPSWIVPFLFH
jgi:hypothetical protein